MAGMERESSEKLEDQVGFVIENAINPELLKHNGWIELVQLTEAVAYVRFRGTCSGCSSVYETFEEVVKPKLMEAVTDIRDVVISEEVSEELLAFSRSLFTHQK